MSRSLMRFLLLLPALLGAGYAHADVGSDLRLAAAAQAQGRFSKSVVLYDQAIAWDPANQAAHRGRGLSLFALAKYTAAAADFGYILKRDAGDPYAMIWRCLALARAGLPARTELQLQARSLRSSAWPMPVIRYLTGNTGWIPMFEAIGKPQSMGHGQRLCDAQVFYGENELLEGSPQEAMGAFFQAASKDCLHNPASRALARNELKRLERAGVRTLPTE